MHDGYVWGVVVLVAAIIIGALRNDARGGRGGSGYNTPDAP